MKRAIKSATIISMNVKQLFTLYKRVKIEEQAERKQREFDALSALPINYGIIRDLINSAQNDVKITVTFPDGTKLDIKREDAFDRKEKTYVEGW